MCSLHVQDSYKDLADRKITSLFEVPASRLLNDGTVSSSATQWFQEIIKLPPFAEAGHQLQLIGKLHRTFGALGLDNIHIDTTERCSPR